MARQGNVRTTTLTGAIAVFLPARRNRVALTLFPSGTDYTISNDPSVAATAGIYVKSTATVPVYLDFSNSGDLVAQTLYAVGAAQTFAFIEVLEGD